VDNYHTGTRRNIAHLLDHTNFEMMRHDITHPLFVEVDEISISPAPRARCTTSTIRCRPPRCACSDR
jgi:hypothetical protein